MPVNFEIPEKSTLSDVKEPRIHYIPAKIDGDGKADVSNYFDNYTEKLTSSGSTEIFSNAFRGFPLKGCDFKLPEGKIGVIFRESQELIPDNVDRELKFAGTFKNFTYWNYDVNPSDNDALRKTVNALSVMEAVHKKVVD
uniref:CSON008015 protein n=1 Tax=Culicoides sonorensis TaxID=179676 RepID=A0A336LYF9_CULSO